MAAKSFATSLYFEPSQNVRTFLRHALNVPELVGWWERRSVNVLDAKR